MHKDSPSWRVVEKGLRQIDRQGLVRLRRYILASKPLLFDGNISKDGKMWPMCAALPCEDKEIILENLWQSNTLANRWGKIIRSEFEINPREGRFDYAQALRWHTPQTIIQITNGLIAEYPRRSFWQYRPLDCHKTFEFRGAGLIVKNPKFLVRSILSESGVSLPWGYGYHSQTELP